MVDFVMRSAGIPEPLRLSAGEIVDHLSSPENWHEASIGPLHREHPVLAAYPLMNAEFHGRAGFSLLLFPDERSNGILAATRAELSEPSVYVCLGGQVIEKWPPELFLSRDMARTVIEHFLSAATPDPSCPWIRLERFPRKTVHSGGKGLIPMWDKLSAAPHFPFAS